MEATLSPAVIEALAIGNLPEVNWKHGDDLCDCTYQRIGEWSNPYLAETLQIRLCCVWAKLGEMFPGTVRSVPASWDYNAHEWVTVPAKWDGETDMPAYLWHRQVARLLGVTLAEARERNLPAPKGVASSEGSPFLLPSGGEYVEVRLR